MITLYQFEMCPFCAKVRAKLDELKIEYKKVNVANDRSDPKRQEIANKSGVASVPVINDGDVWMGESGDIVAYLEEKYA